MEISAAAIYRPRRPQESPLYRLAEDQFDTLVGIHERQFQQRYGRLRGAARRAVEKYLDCGILDQGFARVVCERCRAEFLVAFSCKTRYFCPSCHAKRLEIWADWLEHELLYAVPHRQFVFTVPKRLRPFFLHDRRLLGLLSRVAYRTLRDFMRTTLREPDAVPGVVSSIQTFGSLANWHPHLHLLVTDGVFRIDGAFIHLGFHQVEILTEAFRRALLRAFVSKQLLNQEQATSMLAWPHSGFHVHHAVRLEADDACGILQLARYAARAPISLQRLHYDARKRRVQVVSDKSEGPTAGTHEFEALEFLARLLTHVPDKNNIYVRYYGAYSVRRRARWRKEGVLRDTRNLADTDVQPRDDSTAWPQIQARRRRWAELLQRIFEVDPLACPRCGGAMKIIAFILDHDVIHTILKHLRKTRPDPARLPQHDDLLLARAPP
jgi:hypothetical protein